MLNKFSLRPLAILGLILFFSVVSAGHAAARVRSAVVNNINKFSLGDTVSVTAQSLTVRKFAGITSRALGYQNSGSKGVVTAGPKTSNSTVWWQINFDSGADGWVAEKYLTLVSPIIISTAPPVTSTPPPTTTPTPAPITPTPTTTPTPVPAPTVPPTSITPTPSPATLQWGAFVADGNLAGFEQLVGKQVNLQATFIGWGDDFPSAMATSLKQAGKTLVIFWEQYGVTLDAINSGTSDAYIKKFADAAKASGATIILAPLHEMNGNWDPWDGPVGSNTPAKVIAVWKRIHDSFSGTTNVKFAWDVNNVSEPNTSANAISVYYPGDAYVDYVAVDGFNFGGQTWDQVFPSALMGQLASYHKPVYILSTASVPSSQKAQWITAMGAGIKKYPSIAGWVWFNQNGADGNWLVNSDSASLAAFKAILP